MASKAIAAGGDDRPVKRQGENPVSKFFGNLVSGVVEQWKEFTQFLSDVRAEMRKVVTPTWKEVKSTTAVVIIAVFLFGFFFFVVDTIFNYGMNQLLRKLGGLQ
jgi:preprotein translocase subunit SecE